MLTISYASCLGLSPAICCNSLLKYALQPIIAKKITKNPYFEGSKSFRIINVDKSKKPVTSTCYDNQHVYTHLQLFSHYTSQYWQNHRCAVVQPFVNGDRLSQWRMAKFDPAQIRNPSTDRHKIWNRWLHPQDDHSAKFRANPSMGGFLAIGWNITKIFLAYTQCFIKGPLFLSFIIHSNDDQFTHNFYQL